MSFCHIFLLLLTNTEYILKICLFCRCCRDDGLILRPSVPAFVIDNLIKQNAFSEGKPSGKEIWKSRSEISGITFGIVFAAMMDDTYKLYPNEAGFPMVMLYY